MARIVLQHRNRGGHCIQRLLAGRERGVAMLQRFFQFGADGLLRGRIHVMGNHTGTTMDDQHRFDCGLTHGHPGKRQCNKKAVDMFHSNLWHQH